MDSKPTPTEPPKYRWPRYLLAAVILGIVLSIYAIYIESQRIRTFERTDPLFQRPPQEAVE